MEAVGLSQVDKGDLEGALRTAAEMEPGWSDGVLFGIAQEFRQLGDARRAHKIAKRITDPDMARVAEGKDTESPGPPRDACAEAWDAAKSGNAGAAYDKLAGKKCSCTAVANIYDQLGDAPKAERALRSCPNPADTSYGMAELAKKAAGRGNITVALQLASSVHVTGAYFEEGYLAPVYRDIAHAWVASGSPTPVLRWARSLPNGYERALALLGVAESVRPTRIEQGYR